MSNDWRTEHKKVIETVLSIFNKNTNKYILKGGTALMQCYELDRFSEDIDMDSIDTDSEKYIKEYCKNNNATYRIAKDTDTTTRYLLHYGGVKPLKIEISHRNKNIDTSLTTKINGISVYTIDALCVQKSSAYKDRDKIRDLYDLGFIGKNYYDDLSPITKAYLSESLSHKGLQQFDYVMSTQEDELIDKGELPMS